jgi:2-polyprenyl-3-methyl-5-hydroxy-6-metoxy-1,4-benzoquinol methylase
MIIAISSKLIDSLFRHWGMHLLMLKDRVRMDTYRGAIESAVRPGDVVIDIGTGTGIMAFLAARAGARKVYAIERTEIIKLAKQLAEENRLDMIVDFIHGESKEIVLPEKADVIISELIGIFALDENMLTTLLDARARFLKPGGQIIPSKIDLYVAPIESEFIFDQTSLQSHEVFGLDFAKAEDWRQGSIFAADLCTANFRFLGNKTPFFSINSLTFSDPTVSQRVIAHVTEPGTFHGLGGWWEAFLFNDIVLSTDPTSSSIPTSWMNAFFPVKQPIHVQPGDEVVFQCQVKVRNNQIWWDYDIQVTPFP